MVMAESRVGRTRWVPSARPGRQQEGSAVMMKLSTMGMGDQRRDPEGKIPLAALAHDRWSHDPGSLELFRYSSNFVFLFRDRGERRFLRSAHEGQRSRAQIEAEVQLLLWLQEEGIPVAAPLPSEQGNFVEAVETEAGTYHSVVFPGLSGEQLDSDELAEADFRVWGAALGRLHAAIRRYPKVQSAARPSWHDDLALAERHLPVDDAAMARECDDISRALATLPIDAETFGLIHFDFELDNLIWREGTPGIIDFDDAAHHWYAADISFALRDLFDYGISAADARAQSFISGYREHSPIDDQMLAYLPLFSRLERLSGYGRLARALDLDPHDDYQPWLCDLEGRLAEMMRDYPASLER